MKDNFKNTSEFKNYIDSKASCVLPTNKDYKVLKRYAKFQISANSHSMFSASAFFVFTNIKYMEHWDNIEHSFIVIKSLWVQLSGYQDRL